MDYKYLILFPVPEPYNSDICVLMDQVRRSTRIAPPYQKLTPHITFHRPIRGIAEERIKNLVQSMILQMHQTRVTVSDLFPFGKHYIVLPVHATMTLAGLWVGINNLLSMLPEYQHGEFDRDNTLHITIAEKTSEIFEVVWDDIKQLAFEPMTFPVKTVEIHRKSDSSYFWECIAEYQIPE